MTSLRSGGPLQQRMLSEPALVAWIITLVLFFGAALLLERGPRLILFIGYSLGIGVCVISDIVLKRQLRKRLLQHAQGAVSLFATMDIPQATPETQRRSEEVDGASSESACGDPDASALPPGVVAQVSRLTPGAYVSLITNGLDPLERLSMAQVLRNMADQLE